MGVSPLDDAFPQSFNFFVVRSNSARSIYLGCKDQGQCEGEGLFFFHTREKKKKITRHLEADEIVPPSLSLLLCVIFISIVDGVEIYIHSIQRNIRPSMMSE